MTNQQAGVDITAGDSFGDFVYRAFKNTWGSSEFIKVRDYEPGNFRGSRGWRFENLPDDYVFDGTVDGAGTKPIFTSLAMAHNVGAHDPVAMTGGDITRRGGRRVILFNQLDVEKIGAANSQTNQCFRALMQGLADIARHQGFVLWRGETAEMGNCIGSDDPDALTKYVWSATMLGIMRESTMITGKGLRPGQLVVALREENLRTNGFTDLRNSLKAQFGLRYWEHSEAKAIVIEAAKRPRLYDTFFEWINGWRSKEPFVEPLVPVTAIAHITGGGIPGKFGKDLLFPRGLSAELNELWEPTPLVRRVAAFSGKHALDSYKRVHGGQGALAVMEEKHVRDFCYWARRFGHEAKPCGWIREAGSEPKLAIRSKFDGKLLEYDVSDV